MSKSVIKSNLLVKQNPTIFLNSHSRAKKRGELKRHFYYRSTYAAKLKLRVKTKTNCCLSKEKLFFPKY